MNSLTKNLKGPIERIVFLQRKDGCIPWTEDGVFDAWNHLECVMACLLYTSPSPRDRQKSRMPSSA